MQKTMILIVTAILALVPSASHAVSPNICAEEVHRGVASWYGPGFEGARTTSEEVFDPAGLSAAHPFLPFGTKLKVVNMRNHKSVMVTVNDRGAFYKERVIDLSQGAAKQLDMIKSGTAPVALYKCAG